MTSPNFWSMGGRPPRPPIAGSATASDDIITALLKKLSISIKIHVSNAIKSVWSVSVLSTKSVVNRHSRPLRRVGVGGVYLAVRS